VGKPQWAGKIKKKIDENWGVKLPFERVKPTKWGRQKKKKLWGEKARSRLDDPRMPLTTKDSKNEGGPTTKNQGPQEDKKEGKKKKPRLKRGGGGGVPGGDQGKGNPDGGKTEGMRLNDNNQNQENGRACDHPLGKTKKVGEVENRRGYKREV